MFTTFFLELRAAKVPASLREFLTLMEGMRLGVARFDIDEFYSAWKLGARAKGKRLGTLRAFFRFCM